MSYAYQNPAQQLSADQMQMVNQASPPQTLLVALFSRLDAANRHFADLLERLEGVRTRLEGAPQGVEVKAASPGEIGANLSDAHQMMDILRDRLRALEAFSEYLDTIV